MRRSGGGIATRSMNRHARRDGWYLDDQWVSRSNLSAVRLALTCILGSAIFVVDTFTPLSSAVAVLYILPLLIVGQTGAGARVVQAAAAAVILTCTSFVIEHGGSTGGATILRLLFSLVAILTTAGLLHQQAKAYQLHRAQARLLDVTAGAIVLRDASGHVLLWNQGAEALYGWPREAVLGHVHHRLLFSEFPETMEAIQTALEMTGHWQGAIDQERQDGTRLIINSRWQMQYDTKGRPWGILETNSDVTAWRRAEMAGRQGEARYRGIFETQAVAVLEYDFVAVKRALAALQSAGVTDLRGYFEKHSGLLDHFRSEVRVVDANTRALRLFDKATKDAFRICCGHFMPFQRQDFIECLLALDAGSGIFERRVSFKGRDGDVTVIMGFSFPSGDDGLERVPASLIDLTESERVAREMARMRSDLDRAMRLAAIGEVSSSIAHEMNQPLAAIRTYAEATRRWLKREPMDIMEARGALEDVIASAEIAGRVISRARQTFGRARIEKQPVALDDVVSDALRVARPEIDDSGTSLSIDLRANNVTILGDRILLQQAILNFAMNALQAMSQTHGERHLSVETVSDLSTATVILRDTGPGIPSELLERGRDALASGMLQRNELGLAVCRSTVSSHGGRIEIENAPERGAIIKIVLPLSGAVS